MTRNFFKEFFVGSYYILFAEKTLLGKMWSSLFKINRFILREIIIIFFSIWAPLVFKHFARYFHQAQTYFFWRVTAKCTIFEYIYNAESFLPLFVESFFATQYRMTSASMMVRILTNLSCSSWIILRAKAHVRGGAVQGPSLLLHFRFDRNSIVALSALPLLKSL